MAVNDKILISDYNTLRLKIATVMGTGSIDYGYGQTLVSSAVSESSRITVNEWANLGYDITNAYRHITGSAPTLVSAVEGNTVRFNATTSPYTQYDTFADYCVTNRFTVAGSQTITQSKGTTSTTWPGVYGSTWNVKLACTVTVIFSSATKARQFFNAGGEIRFSSSRSGGSALGQNTSWTNLLSSVGTQAFGGNKPGTGLEPNNGQNYFRCSNSYASFYSLSGSSPYGANSFRISARTPAVVDNSNGTASTIEFYIEWIDNYTDPGPEPSPPPGDQVDGTMSLSVSTLEASGLLVPVGTGNFSVESPAITLGAIAPA